MQIFAQILAAVIYSLFKYAVNSAK